MKAILGGTFDPVHRGHVHAGRCARAALKTADVTLLLAARPGHRGRPEASIEKRWRMLQLATADDPGLVASDLEISRPGPSYTVDTLALVKGTEPLVWLIGRDALADVPSWHRSRELASFCHLLVLDRPGGGRGPPFVPEGFERVDDVAVLAHRPSGGLHCLADAMPDVSASRVRQTIAGGGDAGALLPPDVWSYIKEQGLYRFGAVDREPGRPRGAMPSRPAN